MGEDEIAKPLAVAQPGAVADHQPGMGPEDGDVVGRRLRVRRADADIHKGDALPVGAFEVIGRHLRQARKLAKVAVRCRDPCIAGADKGGIARAGIAQRLAGEGLEFINIELVVGEEDVVLEMHRVGRGVMGQPRQRIIHPLRGEGRKVARAVGHRPGGAVDDVVIRRRQVRHVEIVAQRKVQNAVLRHREAGRRRHREMDRDRCRAWPDDHRHAMVADQKVKLLDQVLPEQVGPRDRGGIGAGDRNMPEAETAVGGGVRGHGQPHLGVEGAVARRGAFAPDGAGEILHQVFGGQGVKLFKALDGGLRIEKALDRRGCRRFDGKLFGFGHSSLHAQGPAMRKGAPFDAAVPVFSS